MNSYNVPPIQHVYRWYKAFPNGWFMFFPHIESCGKICYIQVSTAPLQATQLGSLRAKAPIHPRLEPQAERTSFSGTWLCICICILYYITLYYITLYYITLYYTIIYVMLSLSPCFVFCNYSILRHTIKYPHGSLIAVPVFRKNIIRFAHVHIRLNRTYWIILGCHLI